MISRGIILDRLAVTLFCGCMSFLWSINSYAHSIRQRASSYEDDHGSLRQRYKFDSNLKFNHTSGSITATSYALSAGLEQQTEKDIESNDYWKEYYEDGERQSQDYNISASQTWSKLTDSRVILGYSTDHVTTSRTGGLGISRWVWSENLQLSVDVSRTVVEQPLFEILDTDSDIIGEPTVVSSTGTSFGVKSLATPTTVTNVSWLHMEKNNRPPTNVYSGGVKQFIPMTKSAVHIDVSRAFNQGRIKTDTTYGEVDAWILQGAFLQSFWTGSNGRLAYRYYRESEVTRVDQEEYVRGTDLISFNISQELTPKDISNLQFPVVVECSVARYKSNEIDSDRKLAANIFEVGIQTKF